MGYLQEVDRWLDMLFTDLADEKISYDDVKRDIRAIFAAASRSVQLSMVATKSSALPPRFPSRALTHDAD
jgi:hypothetical protein